LRRKARGQPLDPVKGGAFEIHLGSFLVDEATMLVAADFAVILMAGFNGKSN
jgi:hypothetical protein